MAWDVDKAVTYLDLHSHHDQHGTPKSLGKCAEYTRKAIETGGVTLIRHGSAKDYGGSLLAIGFSAMGSLGAGSYQKGDVAIIQPISGHPHGHMAMYDGKQWVSDFKQRTLYPGDSYRKAKPSFVIYRYQQPTGIPMSEASAGMAYA